MKAFRKRGFVIFEAVEAPRRMENARCKSKNTQKFELSPKKKNRMNGKKEEKGKKTA